MNTYVDFSKLDFETQVEIMRCLKGNNALSANLVMLMTTVLKAKLWVNKVGPEVNVIGFRSHAELQYDAKEPVEVFNKHLYDKVMGTLFSIEKCFTLKMFEDGVFKEKNRELLASHLGMGRPVFSIVDINNEKGQKFTESLGFIKTCSFDTENKRMHLNVHLSSRFD